MRSGAQLSLCKVKGILLRTSLCLIAVCSVDTSTNTLPLLYYGRGTATEPQHENQWQGREACITELCCLCALLARRSQPFSEQPSVNAPGRGWNL